MADTPVGQTSSKLVILTNDQQLPSYITGYTFYPTWSGAYSHKLGTLAQPDLVITVIGKGSP